MVLGLLIAVRQSIHVGVVDEAVVAIAPRELLQTQARGREGRFSN